MKKLCEFALSILCLLTLLGSAMAFAGQNILYYQSDPGDWIGGGAEVTFSGTDGTFSISPNYDNGVSLSFISPGYTHWWYLNLAAANNADFQPGAYDNAERFPFQSAGHPGLDFSGDGRGCNTLTGRFDVLEVVRDPDGNVTQFAANWEQHCEGGQPALYGQLRYNSDVPLSGKPIHINLQNPLNSQRCVEASGPNGALVTVDGLGITDATGGNALAFAWSTSLGQSASGSTFSFQAPLTQDPTQPVLVTLAVTDLTDNSSKSVNKPICVSDTTPPSIVINHPIQGEIVRGDNLVLDVSINDAVDRNITEYEVQVGSDFVSPINPRTGRSRQQIFDAPKVDGTITTTIAVQVHDASGNTSQQSVTVSEIPAKRHGWSISPPRR